MEEDLLRRAADLAERCERTATVTSTAFLTPGGAVRAHELGPPP